MAKSGIEAFYDRQDRLSGRYLDRIVYNIFFLLFIAWLFLFILMFFSIVPILGPSMMPTIDTTGSTLSKQNTKVFLWGSNNVKYNDIVVIDFEYEFDGWGRLGNGVSQKASGDDSSKNLIKRVVAVQGDTVSIEMHNGVYTLKVNGKWVDEPYINGNMHTGMTERVVSEGCVFVMGDNRNNSTDSRALGEISIKHIVGKVFAIIDAKGFRFYSSGTRAYID